MADCDGYFEAAGIPYIDIYESRAVRYVLADDFYDPPYKKWLIQCWFFTTYGTWTTDNFNTDHARYKMAAFLANQPFNSYEQLIDKLGGGPKYAS